jgi:predicted peroxiredoxin
MPSLLVHVTHGPDVPTRAALGFLVAKTAAEAGHEVTVFCAGDAAYLMKDAVVEHTKGIGTGALSDTLPAVVDLGVPIYVSGGSSKTRGVTEEDIANKGASFATPAQLVELTFAAERVLCY